MRDNANMAIWDELAKTDPSATKNFKRAGGFSGTAIKPMWAWKRMTEQFGSFGQGWGCNEPTFTTVPANGELMVYCTVSGWHGSPQNMVWGVGGDKVIAETKNGMKADDEAFKKAFTDALMNAFKFIGVGADVHLGLFEDSKYLAEMRKEFAPPPVEPISDDQKSVLMTLLEKTGTDTKAFCTYYRIASLPELPSDRYEDARMRLSKKLKTDAGS